MPLNHEARAQEGLRLMHCMSFPQDPSARGSYRNAPQLLLGQWTLVGYKLSRGACGAGRERQGPQGRLAASYPLWVVRSTLDSGNTGWRDALSVYWNSESTG